MKQNGYPEADLDLVRKLGTKCNFYLGHGMKDPSSGPSSKYISRARYELFLMSDRVTHIHVLAVPGDSTSGTESLTGGVRYHLQNGGMVLVDVGRTTMTEDGTILNESGQHPFDEFFVFGDTTALQPLCDALAN